MEALFPTEKLKCWNAAKDLRMKYYQDYVEAHDKGGIRWAGGAWTFDAVPAGLGDDVYPITSEPYGATLAFDKELSLKCLEATEVKGYPRDLCSYMRNYWGSIITDTFAFGYDAKGDFAPRFMEGVEPLGFPKPDFIWQDHICCSHAKWYQVVSELEGGIPTYTVDNAVGPATDINDRKIKYVVEQLKEGIEFLQRVTGRDYDDELLYRAIHNHFVSTSKWAEICELNKNIPAPLDEKSIYSLYVFGTLQKSGAQVADFYENVLLPEVRDRVRRGIAAVPTERYRVMSDTQPPWSFLNIFRYLEEYGCVSVGSLYTFGLLGQWEDRSDGTWGPKTIPDVEFTDRDQALYEYVKYELNKPEWQHFYSCHLKSAMMIRIAREWKLSGVMLHYNRGCEGLTVGIAENRL
ncbi:MAG: benzoyl-CoA reductase, bzd-type, subunit O, partial [Thermoplasmata archaeon]|nr:benzoyl-CoA reductase, bzd-type, subunit O [Thermoplasmata archaeon]